VRPFFWYFGSKWKIAERLGPPQCDHVIEPFAGSAGYSTFWEPTKVTLIERDPVVCGVWKFLQRTSPTELMRLPSNISHVDELLPRVCQEARSFICFWFDHGLEAPMVHRSNWARRPRRAAHYWSETVKLRLARQVERIRHWSIIEGSWEEAANVRAHWHIDAPYSNEAGQRYRFHKVDYATLAKWCKRRRGFAQVCAQYGAEWLPFEPFTILPTRRVHSYTAEAIFEIEN
jgi:hypothetical protein